MGYEATPRLVDANRLQGRDISPFAPSDDEELTWDAVSAVWKPAEQDVAGGSGNVVKAGTFATSTGTIVISAGNNVTISTGASSIQIAAGGGANVVSAFGTGVATSTGTIILAAGNNITLTTGANTISIAGVAAATGVTSLNGSTGSISVSAGAGIGIGQANSTMTISASQVVSAFGTGAATSKGTIVLAAGNNISLSTGASTISIHGVAAATGVTSLNGSTGSLSISAGAGIGIGQANSTITISASASANVVSAFGTGVATSTGTIVLAAGNNITLATGAGSISIAGVAAATGVTSLNASTGQLSISAGAGIGIGQANSTMTISASIQTTNLVSSLNGSSGAISISAGPGIGIGQAGSTITISASGGVGAGVGAIGTGAATSTGTIIFAAGNNITLATGASTISIAGVAAATGVTSLNGSTGSLSISAGANIGIGQANSTITISVSNQSTLTSNLPPRLSYTQNFLIENAGPVFVGTLDVTGSTAATATNNPFGSQLSLQRIFIPAPMSLTEVDLAFGISFPATNQGAGSLSQSLVIYSFGNSTSLASLLSASRAVTWATGTTTSGTASTLQQGWASNNIQPFTFAASSLSAGEYAVAHLVSWAAASTSWFLSVYGATAGSTATVSAVTALTSTSLSAASTFATGSSAITAFTATPTAASALSTTGLIARSVITGITATGAAQNTLYMRTGASNAAGSSASASSTAVIAETWQQIPLYAIGAQSVFSGTGSVNALSNAGTAAANMAASMTTASVAAVTGVSTVTAAMNAAQSGLVSFVYNGTFGMTTAATDASYLSGLFNQGIYKTGGTAASIDLKSTAMTVRGSTALIQPWFALAGS